METNARYTLVGLFTLAVLAAGFSFVYWLNTGGGLGQRAYYRVRYQNSVAGLMVGSPVQFNGVRVGEVTALDLDPSLPTEIAATIAVEAGTPVRADTKAGIVFQGLMGSPAVSLSGGAASGAALPNDGKALPLLTAAPDAGVSMSESATSVLHRLDGVVAENAEPLRTTLANLGKFTDALARNSDRVDGILAGLERMTGGSSKPASPVFELSAVRSFPKFAKADFRLLIVQYPTAPATLGQDKILAREGNSLTQLAPDAKWGDMLLDQVQARIVQSFENADYVRQVSRPVEGATGDYQLTLDIRDFAVAAGDRRLAHVQYAAKLLNEEGKVVGARLFEAQAPVEGADAAAAAGALDKAFGSTASDLVVWTSATIAKAAEAAR